MDPNTTAYLMADDCNLYVAVRCNEPDPAGLVPSAGKPAEKDKHRFPIRRLAKEEERRL